MGWIYNGLEHQELKRENSDWDLLKKIMKGVTPFRIPFLMTILMVLLGTILQLITPIVLADTVNKLSKNSEITSIYNSALLYLGLYILLFLVYFGNNFAMAKLIPDFMVNLRTQVFNSIQIQDLKFFDRSRSGKLTSRVGSDAAESANIVMLMATFGGNLLLIATSLIVMFSVSTELAKLTTLVVPFVILFTWLFRRIARRLSKNYRKSIASVNAAISESVEGIQIAKSFGMERETVEKFKEVNSENVSAAFKQNVAMEFIFPILDIFAVLGLWFILQFGGTWAVNEQYNLDSSSIYLFILYLNRFFFPLMQLSTFYSQMQAGFAAYERIVEVIDSVPEVDANEGGLIIEDFKGEIEFINTDFGYGNELILQNFNLHLKPGERLAIVGHTGAGKTTIANVISRFYEFQGGEVKIDGVDIRSLDLKIYRNHLGIVQQDPFLFSGTVEENIRYGNQDATDEDMMKAIQAVHADEFLQYMPDGLETEVGERGSRLSTGQRQLVCFARALLSDPGVIILDEATSAVDAYTESVIQEALETLFKDRTSVIIAHRLSTVVSADRIIVLDHGKIIEEGSHSELMSKGGKYQELYDTYFRHQALVIPKIKE